MKLETYGTGRAASDMLRLTCLPRIATAMGRLGHAQP